MSIANILEGSSLFAARSFSTQSRDGLNTSANRARRIAAKGTTNDSITRMGALHVRLFHFLVMTPAASARGLQSGGSVFTLSLGTKHISNAPALLASHG